MVKHINNANEAPPQTSILPSVDNSYDLGSSTFRWNEAYIDTITNNLLYTNEIVSDDNDNIIDITSDLNPTTFGAFSLGSTTKRWLSSYIDTMYATLGYVNELNGLTTTLIETASDFLPKTDNTWSLGSALKAWQECFATSFYGSLMSTDNITSNAAANITCDVDIVPSVTNINQLGTAAKRWSVVHATTIQAPGIQTDSLAALTSSITVSNDVLPSPTLIREFGGTNNRWRNVVSQTVTGDNPFEIRDSRIAYGEFNSNSVTVQGDDGNNAWTKLPVVFSNSLPFDAGSNEIKFPYKGFYTFYANISWDTNNVSVEQNALRIRIRRLDPDLATEYQEWIVGNTTGQWLPPRGVFYFKFEISSTNDRIIFEGQRTTDNITNVTIREGCVILQHRFR